jgi:hypothetical protein
MPHFIGCNRTFMKCGKGGSESWRRIAALGSVGLDNDRHDFDSPTIPRRSIFRYP